MVCTDTLVRSPPGRLKYCQPPASVKFSHSLSDSHASLCIVFAQLWVSVAPNELLVLQELFLSSRNPCSVEGDWTAGPVAKWAQSSRPLESVLRPHFSSIGRARSPMLSCHRRRPELDAQALTHWPRFA